MCANTILRTMQHLVNSLCLNRPEPDIWRSQIRQQNIMENGFVVFSRRFILCPANSILLARLTRRQEHRNRACRYLSIVCGQFETGPDYLLCKLLKDRFLRCTAHNRSADKPSSLVLTKAAKVEMDIESLKSFRAAQTQNVVTVIFLQSLHLLHRQE